MARTHRSRRCSDSASFQKDFGRGRSVRRSARFDPRWTLPMLKFSAILDRPRNQRGRPMTPDEMIERLLHPSSDADGGVVANELLAAFCRDYPIENLRRLFVPASTGYAAFLASELGQRVRPLLREVAELLEDGTPRVRGDAIEALSLCTTWEDGWAIAKIVRMLGDPHEGVRWMACRALRYMESSQVLAGLEYLRACEPTSIFASFENAFLAGKPRADASMQGQARGWHEPRASSDRAARPCVQRGSDRLPSSRRTSPTSSRGVGVRFRRGASARG
jgi:hypothetical protein